MNGLLLVDKPAGVTSHDVVARLRKEMGIRRIGHAGTLDPLATGLLPALLGQATRLSQFFQGMEKEYWVRSRLGQESDTLDVSGKILRCRPVSVSLEEIQRAAAALTGEIAQVPPMFSAKRAGGRRLYQMARSGVTVERSPRRVFVSRLEILKLELPEIELQVCCSSGTYIRSLVHDLGQMLGCGALVSALRRTAVGSYRVEDATPLQSDPEPAGRESLVISLEKLLPELPRRTVQSEEAARVCRGQALGRREDEPLGWIRLFDCDERLIALGRVEESRIHPRIVLMAAT